MPSTTKQCTTNAHLRAPVRMECLLAQDCQLHSPNHFTTPFDRPAASSEKARSALKKVGCSVAIIVWREKAPVRRAERPTEAIERNILVWVLANRLEQGTISNERWSGAVAKQISWPRVSVFLRPASECSERQLVAGKRTSRRATRRRKASDEKSKNACRNS